MSNASFDPQRAARALAIVRGAFDREGPARARWIANETLGDDVMRAEVERLLAADDSAGGPLDRPLMQQVAEQAEGADPRIGTRVGPFVLRELLGRGGMGNVYRAERDAGDFRQTVAVKLLRLADGDDAQAARRFARERQILVRLQHPNIAHFLDGGVSGHGQPWYALELVEGESITQHAERAQASVAARLQWVMQVCDAVQYAHQNLVLHRDLKPANILIDAQSQVKLLDFGIAKLLQSDNDGDDPPTRTEHRAFTPDYAAPEQLEGGAVSTATDLFALGVLLFELLTGRRPFRRSGGIGSLVTGERGAVEAPSRVLARETGDARRAARLRGDLDTIVLTCLQLDPARRYVSAAALKRDLERHLAGLPIDARPDSFGYRTSKFVRRHRVGVAAGSVLVLALLATTALSITQARRAERESARATLLAASAQRERDAALDETRRQEILREHFVAVLNRATESGAPIEPDTLLSLAANPRLLGEFGDAQMQSALQLTLSDLMVQRGDYPRTLALLDTLEPALAPGDGRAIALAAANRAFAALRVGQLDVAEAALDRAQTSMTPEQHSGGMLDARLKMLRGQLLRARGQLDEAARISREAAETAFTATDGSALERGTVIGTGSTAMLMVGDLDAALELADRAEAVWRESGVEANFSTRTVATQRANVLFLRGNLLAAQAAIDVINTDADSAESAPARAARDATQAKLLALLGHRNEAIALMDGAVRAMCDNVGRDSLDCLRLRLTAVDTRALAGDVERAQIELDAIHDLVAAQPPLAATAAGFATLLSLRRNDTDAALSAVLDTIPAGATAGALPRRNAVRALLMLAETLTAAGRHEQASALARAAIDTAGDAIDGNGMDRSLLTLWRAQLANQPPPQDALDDLAAAVGTQHRFVVSRRTSAESSTPR
jgi:serine/threonine protein kinase